MKAEIKTRIKSNIIYFWIFAIAGIVSIASRNFPDYIPDVISHYGGDILWAFAMFFLLSIFIPGTSALLRALITLGISWIVELSQFYHDPWIDYLRSTVIGGLILGFSFSLADILCYLVGIILAAAFETLILEQI